MRDSNSTEPLWARRDLNSQPLRDMVLSHARIPIPPLAQSQEYSMRIETKNSPRDEAQEKEDNELIMAMIFRGVATPPAGINRSQQPIFFRLRSVQGLLKVNIEVLCNLHIEKYSPSVQLRTTFLKIDLFSVLTTANIICMNCILFNLSAH